MFFIYKLFELNYLYQDLEPYLSTHTIGIHYLKHSQGYLDRLNKILKKNNFNFNYSMEELPFHLNDFSYDDYEDILFNLGGVLNHNLYFKGISKDAKKPTGLLLEEITKQFGSFDNFWHKLIDNALKLKGSGYVFLEMTYDGNIVILNRSNQDNPIFQGNIPLFCIDMWEHAYYLNNENNKKEYLDNLYFIANFSYASRIFEKCIYNRTTN